MTKQTDQPDLAEPIRNPRRPFGRADWVAFLVLLLVASVMRMWALADPPTMVFDEIYYAKDACFYVLTSENPCEVDGNQLEVHPPVGKWLIGAGIKTFGFDSFGWRVGPALGGVVTVMLLFLLARRLFGSWIWGAFAGGLLALDPLHFVQSRISMLDIFVPMFGLAAILMVVLDRDRMAAAADRAGNLRAALLERPWRAGAGVAAGLAVATKWTGGFFLALVIVLTVVWEVATRSGPRSRALAKTLRYEGLSIAVLLVAVPILLYVLSWAGQVQGQIVALPWSEGSWGRALWDHHDYMWGFHRELTVTHPYQSPPWSWILIKRPVSYFFCSGAECDPAIADGNYAEIFAVGNPLVWWVSLVAIVGLIPTWIRRRNYNDAAGLILAGILFTYGPWLVPGAERPAMFIFYLLPTLPFMMLALTYWAHRIWVTWEGRVATAVFAAGVVASFVFYLPLLTKMSIPQPDWDKRIWVFDNCDKPPGDTVTTTITVTENGKATESVSETQDNNDLPPSGWCWI